MYTPITYHHLWLANTNLNQVHKGHTGHCTEYCFNVCNCFSVLPADMIGMGKYIKKSIAEVNKKYMYRYYAKAKEEGLITVYVQVRRSDFFAHLKY